MRTRQLARYRIRKNETALDLDRLIVAAMDAWRMAYCPYSNYRVGAAILTRDGSLFAGCNVECADYLGTHAEEGALAMMTMAGKRAPEYLVVFGALDSDDPRFVSAPPCGSCRQKLMEFAQFSDRDLKIITSWDEEGYEYVHLTDLLPEAFGPVSIGVDLGNYGGE